ncbi:MAG: LysR family substrate-binding domain-containing protein, partial [Acidobacteriaceae bacterium]
PWFLFQQQDHRTDDRCFQNFKYFWLVSDLHFERPDDPVLRMTSLHTVGIIRGVLEGQYQAGIGYLPIRYSELETRELLDEDLMLCIPARHRLFRYDLISPQDLDREPLIGVSEHALPEVHKEINAYFELLGIELNVIARPFTFYEAIHMTAAGRGIAMVSRGWSHLTKAGIAFRPLADKLLIMKSGVFVRRDNRSGAVNDFQNLLWVKTQQLRNERQKMTLNPHHGSG